MTENIHLSKIATSWTMVRNANDAGNESRKMAQEQLLSIYSNSIRRYLLASLKEESAADEVYQNFALKLIRGDFSKADPNLGKFRSFVKTVLYRMMMDHHRSKKSKAKQNELLDELAVDDSFEIEDSADAAFQQHWREGLLNFAWDQLKQHQSETDGVYHSLLWTKARNPSLSNTELLEKVATECGQEINPGSIRVTLHRARQKFSDFLLEALASAIENPTEENVEEELISLNLSKYKVCSDAMDRRRSS